MLPLRSDLPRILCRAPGLYKMVLLNSIFAAVRSGRSSTKLRVTVSGTGKSEAAETGELRVSAPVRELFQT